MQTADVVVLADGGQPVDDLLQRLHLTCQLHVAVEIGPDGEIKDLVQRLSDGVQLLLGGRREGDLFFIDLLCYLDNIDGVVTQTLEVADGVENLGADLAVLTGEGLCGQLDQIGAQLVLVAVQSIFHLHDTLRAGRVIFLHQIHGQHQDILSLQCHVGGDVEGFGHGHRGGAQQTLVQQDVVVGGGGGRVGGLFPHQALGEPHQIFGHRQQQRRGHQIEDGVHQCDLPGLDALGDEGPVKDGVQQQKARKAQDGADDLDGHMEDGHPFGLYIGADAGDQRGGACADVLAHNDGDSHAVGDAACEGQGLQDTDRGRRALDDAGEQGAYQHAHQGILEFHQQLLEFRHIGQRADCARHHLHAVHQHGKAHEHRADALAGLLFGEHNHDDARKGQQGRKVLGLEHLDPEDAALDARKTGQPGGKGGADVGAEDDMNGLTELHDARVHQTHQHDGGGRGRLDGDGDHRAQHDADERVGCHFAQHFLQPAAGHLFQTAGHDVHAEQEKGQTAQQGDEGEDIQAFVHCSASVLSFDLMVTQFPLV